MGMMVMISANHFLTLYLGLELMSLALYALVALNRDSALSTEAAMKYFVLGALASGLLLYGMSMIYGATGTLDISQVAKAIAIANPNKTVLTFGLVFLSRGWHSSWAWCRSTCGSPDVYHGAPTAMTLLIGSAPKLAAFAMAMRLLVNGLLDLALDWQQMLLIMSVLSMAVGNLAADRADQHQAHARLLDHFAHGFHAARPARRRRQRQLAQCGRRVQRRHVYVVVYVLTTLGTFGMVMLLSRAGFEAENLTTSGGSMRAARGTPSS